MRGVFIAFVMALCSLAHADTEYPLIGKQAGSQIVTGVQGTTTGRVFLARGEGLAITDLIPGSGVAITTSTAANRPTAIFSSNTTSTLDALTTSSISAVGRIIITKFFPNIAVWSFNDTGLVTTETLPGTPNLQQVTDVGANTTDPVTLMGFGNGLEVTNDALVDGEMVVGSNFTANGPAEFGSSVLVDATIHVIQSSLFTGNVAAAANETVAGILGVTRAVYSVGNIATSSSLIEGVARVLIPSRFSVTGGSGSTYTAIDSAGTGVLNIPPGAGLTSGTLTGTHGSTVTGVPGNYNVDSHIQNTDAGTTGTRWHVAYQHAAATTDAAGFDITEDDGTTPALTYGFDQWFLYSNVGPATLGPLNTGSIFCGAITTIGAITEISKRVLVPSRLTSANSNLIITSNDTAGTALLTVSTVVGTTSSLQQTMAVGHTTTFSYDSTNYIAATRDIMTSGTFRGASLITTGNAIVAGFGAFTRDLMTSGSALITGNVNAGGSLNGGSLNINSGVASIDAGGNTSLGGTLFSRGTTNLVNDGFVFTYDGGDTANMLFAQDGDISGNIGFSGNPGTQGFTLDQPTAINGPISLGTTTIPESGAYVQAPSFDIGAWKDQPPPKKTSNYTLVSGTDHAVLADGTSGAFTVTLPASPAPGDFFTVTRINSGANNITVARNGNNINQAASNRTLTTQNQSETYHFYTTNGWQVE